MIVTILALCPRSWKLLFLLKEQNCNFEIHQLALKTQQLYPFIENNQSDLSYVLSNLNVLLKSSDDINQYGYWLDYIECRLIPEIIMPIRHERVIKPLTERLLPDINILKTKRKQLKDQLIYLENYLQDHYWLIANYFSIADISLATAIAVLDYLGEMPWNNEEIKSIHAWYFNIKTKKNFHIILEQKCHGISAHNNFKQLN